MSSKNYRYKHIYSAVEDKAPSASTLMTGEIAVNGNAGNEKLFIKNSNNDVVSFDRIVVDSALNSGSTNPVANSAITEAIEDLEERKADWLSATTSGVVITATSGNTLEYFNRSGDTLFKIELPVEVAVKGDENTIHAEINPQNEKVVSSLVYLKKITTGLPETVKERYQLVGADGNPYTTASGDTSANVDIYKDSHIVSITYITDSGDTHYQNLEYKYIDASGDTQTTYVDISEIIIEAEVGDGLEVDSHIIKGKIDPASEKVVTEYTSAGTSAQTEEVLTVGENGFKASNIQLAIDTKAEVNHKLYDVVNGVYEASSHTITFVSENDDLFDTELTFDNALNSGSANAVQNKVVKEEIEKRQIKNVELTQSEYDALVSAGTVDEETLYVIVDAEAVDTSKYVTSASITSNTSAYTISFSGESGELFDVEFNKGGDGKKMIEGTNIKITSGETADTIAVSASTAITSASTEVVTSKAIYDALALKQDKLTAGSGITITDDNVISAESGNKVVELTQAAYSALTDIDPDTFYIITDAEPIDTSKYVTSGSISSNTSAYTLSFSGESGELFAVQFNKGEGKTYSAGTSITIDSANTISVDTDYELDSGSTNPVANSAITEALTHKYDKDDYVNQHYPKGTVLTTTTNRNPSEYLGGTWSLIGGEDADSVYYPAFAISGDSGLEVVDESLPNITGVIGMHNQGAISISGSALFTTTGTGDRYTVDGANASSTQDKLNFDASRSSAVYQDGAQVKVKGLKLFFWERVDDSEIVEAFTPFTAGSGITIDNGVISSEWKNFVDIQHPQGSVYITYEYKNPSTWLGGEWELIGGSDDSKTYWPAMAIATDAAGTVVNETLPNVTASTKGNIVAHGGGGDTGALSFGGGGTAGAGGSGSMYYGNFTLDLSNGNSVYQDGAQVAVESIKLFYWRRTDNATIAQSVVPFDFINTIDKDNPSTTKSVTEKGIVDYVKNLIIDIEHPVGSTYLQMPNDEDPNVKYSGTTWVEDTSYDGRYFMVDSTNSAGTEIAESLPNIGGYWTDQAGGGNSLPKYGAFANSSGYGASCWGTDAGGKTSRVDFKASKGQLNASGGYVSEADSVYKNGASVHPLTVTIKIWTRTA